MIFPTIMFWVWMAAQGGNTSCVYGHCAEFSHMPLHAPWSPRWMCIEVRQYTDGTIRIYGGRNPHCDDEVIYAQTELPQPDKPAPAEHSIDSPPVTPSEFDDEIDDFGPPSDVNDGAWNWVKPSPAEHVIEIRTKHKLNGKAEACYYATTNGTPNCQEIKYDGHCPDGMYCHELYDVTREIWIDGVKWGVLRESSR